MALPGISDLSYPIITDADTSVIERQRSGLLFNYETQQFIKMGGKFVKMNNIDSIRDWIERNSRTLSETFASLTEYDADFGTIFEEWIGNSFDIEYVKVIFKKECKRAFEKHPEIESVTNINIDIENTKVEVSYKANLLDGISFSGQFTIF